MAGGFILERMLKSTHALAHTVFQETDFIPKRVVAPPLHDTGRNFRSGTATGASSGRVRDFVLV